MALSHLVEPAIDSFRTRFGRAPTWVVSAPGRVNLIGEHTDYNQGLVLPLAIDRHTVIAAAPTFLPEDGNRFYSQSLDESGRFFPGNPAASGEPSWLAYVRGVWDLLGARGACLPPVEAVIHSDIPLGGGLSSSAALTVATATLARTAAGFAIEPLELAQLCQEVEHRYAGVPCGLMDPLCSVLGREDCLLFIDCQSLAVRYIPFHSPAVAVMVLDSGVHHDLAAGEYARRRADCQSAARRMQVASLRALNEADLESHRGVLGDQLYRRARHVVSENRRVEQWLAALENQNWQVAGDLLYASHASLQADYEVSCPELDCLVSLARDIGVAGGVWGSRLTGGGFGGCTVSLIDPQRFDAIRTAIAYRYFEATGIQPRMFMSRPVAGARGEREPAR